MQNSGNSTKKITRNHRRICKENMSSQNSARKSQIRRNRNALREVNYQSTFEFREDKKIQKSQLRRQNLSRQQKEQNKPVNITINSNFFQFQSQVIEEEEIEVTNQLMEEIEVTNQMMMKDQMVEEYKPEIIRYLLSIENDYLPDVDKYRQLRMDSFNSLNRAVVINWLVECHLNLNLLPQTLFMAVNVFDRYLATTATVLSDLPIIAITSLFLSSKYEERYSPKLKYFLHVSDYCCNDEQVYQYEQDIIIKLKFDFNVPSTYKFYEIFAEQCGLGLLDTERKEEKDYVYEKLSDQNQLKRRQQLLIGRFLLEYCLLDFNSYNAKNSQIAASIVYIINKLYKRESYWNDKLVEISGHDLTQLRICGKYVLKLYQNGKDCNLVNIINKFKHDRYEQVSTFTLPNRIQTNESQPHQFFNQ